MDFVSCHVCACVCATVCICARVCRGTCLSLQSPRISELAATSSPVDSLGADSLRLASASPASPRSASPAAGDDGPGQVFRVKQQLHDARDKLAALRAESSRAMAALKLAHEAEVGEVRVRFPSTATVSSAPSSHPMRAVPPTPPPTPATPLLPSPSWLLSRIHHPSPFIISLCPHPLPCSLKWTGFVPLSGSRNSSWMHSARR